VFGRLSFGIPDPRHVETPSRLNPSREGARAALKVKDWYKSQTNMLQNNGLQCRSGLRIHFVSGRTGHLGAGKDGCAPPINLAVPTS